MIVDEWLLDAGFINLNQHFCHNKQGHSVHKTAIDRETNRQNNRELDKNEWQEKERDSI